MLSGKESNMNQPKPFEKYRHFKGNLYQIIAIAEHSESGEELVIYQALYGDYPIYARPLSMFMEEIDRAKYPEAAQKYRFELVTREMIESAGENNQVKERTAEPTADAAKEQKNEMKYEQEASSEPEQEVINLDPLVVAFLDADSYSEKLNILTGLHHRITDDMINVMAMASDLEIREMDVEERYMELKNCLLKMEKFECNRLR